MKTHLVLFIMVFAVWTTTSSCKKEKLADDPVAMLKKNIIGKWILSTSTCDGSSPAGRDSLIFYENNTVNLGRRGFLYPDNMATYEIIEENIISFANIKYYFYTSEDGLYMSIENFYATICFDAAPVTFKKNN